MKRSEEKSHRRTYCFGKDSQGSHHCASFSQNQLHSCNLFALQNVVGVSADFQINLSESHFVQLQWNVRKDVNDINIMVYNGH